MVLVGREQSSLSSRAQILSGRKSLATRYPASSIGERSRGSRRGTPDIQSVNVGATSLIANAAPLTCYSDKKRRTTTGFSGLLGLALQHQPQNTRRQ